MTTMRQQFNEYIEKSKAALPEETRNKMSKAIQELEDSNEGKGLRVGEDAPDFTLPDAKGSEVNLYDVLENGPVILTFYRGGWCPYCNLELQSYQAILEDIHAEGAELMAISPQQPDASLSTQEKNDLQFHVLSDEGNQIADEFNLVYSLPGYLAEIYKEKQFQLEERNGDDSYTLPVAATYIITKDGKIAYEYTKADYKDRAEPSEVLAELKKLNK
ncbi:alkyl hydroperoxide reductase [Pontibacillus halophilus JSM 076056 = DSM 19796]|uniref:thioredoxin-dependent peroxiredoxin n=1 Tax=Pontibacillus halophilus JSM 076056 = DSM 19796 TaxID=1385510 RepID=A0A0A5GNZ3_9BACI|nr:peroxiredoxin-like family protein [Pontibacillus halophilus]KGX92953.1 alkyl hydroperoxide reductase [Pontibacillus halophilus JSM 076056 = DSM 19796]